MEAIFGQDIKLDTSGQPLVAANGELILTEGVETGIQDIRLRLQTPLGQLFYDTEFGSLAHEWYLDENSQAGRMAFEAEVERRVDEDPRVEVGTVACKITSWDDKGFTALLEWQFIGEDHPYNLVISYNSGKKEMLIGDINPEDLVSKSLDAIRQDMFANLAAKQEEYSALGWLPIRLNLNKGIVRGLIELWCWGLWQLYQFLALVLKQAFADSATGLWLDLHCKQVNVYRKAATKARGMIYFTRLASVGNVPIPAGRIVRTKPDGAGNVYRFVSLADVVFPDGSTGIAVEVEAEEYGQAANATAGQISDISTTIPGVDGVENRAGWLTSEGTDAEGDELLRARYVLAWLEKSGCTKYAYMAWALAVTGVSEVRILDQHPRGQGTVDVIITGSAGVPTANLIDAVEAAIMGTGNDDELQPINDDVEVRGPVATNVAVAAQLEIIAGDPTTILAEAENRMRALFRGSVMAGILPLGIGQDATIDRLRVPLMLPNVKKINWTTPAADVAVAADGLAVLQSLALTYTVVGD